MAEKINSIEELRRMQEAAQAQGSTVTNYSEWEQILQDFDDAGIQSTGSYSGDKQLHMEITQRLQQYMEQAKEEQVQQEQFQNNAPENVSKNDGEQSLKATLANSVSSTITSDLMKYYHNLM